MSDLKRFDFALPPDEPAVPRDGKSAPVHSSGWDMRKGCVHVFWSSTAGHLTSRRCDCVVRPYDKNGHLYYPATCPDCSVREREARCNARRAAGVPCYCRMCRETESRA